MGSNSLIGRLPAEETRRERAQRLQEARQLRSVEAEVSLLAPSRLPLSKMPAWGWKGERNLRGPIRIQPPSHRASSRVLGGAYPFLAETGDSLTGPYIGENILSRAPFCMDPWDAYAMEAIRSHSVAVIGVKGTGKSMLAKSWASRLIRVGRKVAVPHDPNGEWVRVAAYVGGKSISVGPGRPARINLMDPGTKDPNLSGQAWRHEVLHFRRVTIKTIIGRLRQGPGMDPVEHTALDIALESLVNQSNVTVSHVLNLLLHPAYELPDDVMDSGRRLGHSLRRMVHGDLAGLFDGPSTVKFDTNAPMMVVDTSALKGASPEAQALARLATSNWIRRSTFGGNKEPRVIVHEEAAVELLNDVAGGEGLVERATNEKTARHVGTSNWYLLHRIADLDALGDRGSALHSQALGLLADCDTRVSYAQHIGEIARSSEVLGWNETESDLVRNLRKGEGLWQIGQDRVAKVRNICTDGELSVFRTDALGGHRS
jgi:hypothetical protein